MKQTNNIWSRLLGRNQNNDRHNHEVNDDIMHQSNRIEDNRNNRRFPEEEYGNNTEWGNASGRHEQPDIQYC